MKTRRHIVPAPAGISFEVPDLLLLQSWAEFHDLRVSIELDHVVEGGEFEEIIAVYKTFSRYRRWTLWREPESIVVQPHIGGGRWFRTVADALAGMIPPPPDAPEEDIQVPVQASASQK